ncbi:MAG: sulfite exporter TauE/SafE family protein [Tepidisphaerales bacterium]
MTGWLFVILGALMVGITKSGFGSGAGLMIVPITLLGTHYLGWENKAALAMILPLLCFGDIIAAWQHRAHFDRRIVGRLLPGSLLGVVAGSLLLRWFNHQRQQVAEAMVNLDVGFESVVLVGLHWYRLWRARGQLPLFRPGFARTSVVGLFAGLSSTMAHAAGPIIALHLLPQRMPRRVYVGTCAIYFLVVNGCKFPGYVAADMFTGNVLLSALRFCPLVLVGAMLGVAINKRISDQMFSAVVYALAFGTGWYILFKGIAQLSGHW